MMLKNLRPNSFKYFVHEGIFAVPTKSCFVIFAKSLPRIQISQNIIDNMIINLKTDCFRVIFY